MHLNLARTEGVFRQRCHHASLGGRMNDNSSELCSSCNTTGQVICKRSFLGFEKCRCSKCGNGYERPLSAGYRITYWLVGIWFAIILLGKLPLLVAASRDSFYLLVNVLVQQWVFVLFVVGAFFALRKDARIKRDSLSSNANGK